MEPTDIFRGAATPLASHGLEVFPVHTVDAGGGCSCGNKHCASAGKHPVGSWTDVATAEPGAVRALETLYPGANVGLATGARSGVVVLDVDAANGKAGPETLATLEAKHGPIPTTVTARTGGGGHHFFFRHPGQRVPNSVEKVGPGIDVRGDGGYVVAAPSKHASGNDYEWVEGMAPSEVELADVPPWLLALMVKPTTPAPERRAERRGADLRSRRVDKKAAGALEKIEEGCRNDRLFRYACALRHRGGEEAEIREEIGLENGLRCVPPLDSAELDRIAANAAKYDPAYPLTDLGNAERLADDHPDVRYNEDKEVWLVYEDGVWTDESREAIQARAKATVRGIGETAKAAGSEQERQEVVKHAKRSESRASIGNMLKLAQAEPGVPVWSRDLDADPMLLNVPNGTLDLRTVRLREHRAGDLITKRTGFAYDDGATCPTFEAFLDRVMGGDQDMVGFLRRAAGYSATGLTDEQVMFFLFGDGANGKSVLVETLMDVLGDYAQKAPTEMITERRSSPIPIEVADLPGARLAVVAEASQGVALDEARVKDLTGGDRIKARSLYQNYFEFNPTHKLWAYGNHRPVVQGNDEGIWRRLLFVPFDVTIPDGQRDPKLKQKLLAEGPGILRWIVEGCHEWQRTGLRPPSKVTDLGKTHRQQSDPVRLFVDDRCTVTAGSKEEVGRLYSSYVSWCRESGESPISKTKFGQRLEKLGYGQHRTGAARYRLGLELTPATGSINGLA